MFPVGVVVREDIIDLLAVIPVDVLYVGSKQATAISGVFYRQRPVVVVLRTAVVARHRRVVGRNADQHGAGLEHRGDGRGAGHKVGRLVRHVVAPVQYRTEGRPVARRPERRRADDDAQQLGRDLFEALEKAFVTVGCRRLLAALCVTSTAIGDRMVD